MTRFTLAFFVFAIATGPGFAQGPVDTLLSLSVNNGLYSNRIVDGEPPADYTEVCFTAGAVQSDLHLAGEPTDGGNCAPGDIGWIIERNERPAATWTDARVECLQLGMRLPEPFEVQLSCDNAVDFGLVGMTGDFEWASNSAVVAHGSSAPFAHGIAVLVFGEASCASASRAWVARDNELRNTQTFRCVR